MLLNINLNNGDGTRVLMKVFCTKSTVVQQCRYCTLVSLMLSLMLTNVGQNSLQNTELLCQLLANVAVKNVS